MGRALEGTETSPLARVVEGLVRAAGPDTTPEQMANSVALLQLDLAEADFHAETLRGARAVRARIASSLADALTAPASYDPAPTYPPWRSCSRRPTTAR